MSVNDKLVLYLSVTFEDPGKKAKNEEHPPNTILIESIGNQPR